MSHVVGVEVSEFGWFLRATTQKYCRQSSRLPAESLSTCVREVSRGFCLAAFSMLSEGRRADLKRARWDVSACASVRRTGFVDRSGTTAAKPRAAKEASFLLIPFGQQANRGHVHSTDFVICIRCVSRRFMHLFI